MIIVLKKVKEFQDNWRVENVWVTLSLISTQNPLFGGGRRWEKLIIMQILSLVSGPCSLHVWDEEELAAVETDDCLLKNFG